MVTRKKLIRFAEIKKFPNVFEGMEAKENIKKLSDKPIILELACGKGEYTVALAQKNSNKIFIGIDIKGERIWRGAKAALDKKLENARFLRLDINLLDQIFPLNSVEEIWITFPDPFPRQKQAKHRLTSPRFLEMYKKILKPNGLINLKTDDKNLFEFTKESVLSLQGKVKEEIKDVRALANYSEDLKITTNFETKHLARGKKIYYLSFSL